MTSGSLTIGGSSTNTLTIQRPILLSSGSNPASASSAIGYQLPIVSSGTGVLSLPLVNPSYTISTGVRTLGIGVWLLSLNVDMTTASNVANFNYNMGFMSSAPITGDSATASSAPSNTLGGINGNIRNDDNTNLTNGTYIYQIGGVVLNNYGGAYNNMYGIFNFTWNTTGTIDFGTFSILATRIG